MTTTQFWHDLAINKSKPTVLRHALFTFIFVLAFVIAPFSVFSQTSSSGHVESIVYKFTVVDLIDPTEANTVQSLLMSKEYAISCTFIDEEDCFKLSSSERISYETLKEALLFEGFILSDKVLLSDGTIIKRIEPQLNQTN